MNLKGVVAQQLVPTPDGKGRRVAMEILLGTPLVQDYIRDGEIHTTAAARDRTRDEVAARARDLALRVRLRVVTAAEAGRLERGGIRDHTGPESGSLALDELPSPHVGALAERSADRRLTASDGGGGNERGIEVPANRAVHDVDLRDDSSRKGIRDRRRAEGEGPAAAP